MTETARMGSRRWLLRLLGVYGGQLFGQARLPLGSTSSLGDPGGYDQFNAGRRHSEVGGPSLSGPETHFLD